MTSTIKSDPIEDALNSLMSAVESLGGTIDQDYAAGRLQDAMRDYVARCGLVMIPNYRTREIHYGKQR